jgi:Fe-S cluster biogenesis protein NfuA
MRQAVEATIGVLRPAIQADGGDLRLVSVDETTGVVQLELSGTCAGCSGQPDARSGGIERILADRVPEVPSG